MTGLLTRIAGLAPLVVLLALAAPAAAASCPGANDCPYSSDTLLDSPNACTVREPEGVGVDPSTGEVVAADTLDDRVVTFKESDGTAVGSPVSSLGADGALHAPSDVAVDIHGNRYVADKFNNRVAVLDAGGTPLFTFAGNGPLAFNQAGSLAVDGAATPHVYVVDTFNNRVIRFTVDLAGKKATADYAFGDQGSPKLAFPAGVTVVGATVYVADQHEVRLYSAGASSATHLTSWGGKDGNKPSFFSPPDVAVGDAGHRPFVDDSTIVFQYASSRGGAGAAV